MNDKDSNVLEDIGAIIAGLIMGGGILFLLWAWLKYT